MRTDLKRSQDRTRIFHFHFSYVSDNLKDYVRGQTLQGLTKIGKRLLHLLGDSIASLDINR